MERAYRRPETLEGSEPPARSSHSTESSSGEPARRPGAADSPLNAARGALREVFGFEGFRPGQEAVIEALLHGRHALTVMPTGSGKSLCFQIPALVMDGLTVVVSPLIALMQDQVSALGLAGVAADCINSANDRGANVAAWRRAAEGRTRLLYMAPERLMTERMLAALARLPVRLFAIDEAHSHVQQGRSNWMNRSEIAGRVAVRTGLRGSEAESAVDAVFEAVGKVIVREEEIRIAGFGTFSTKTRPARTGRNPRTGESLEIPRRRHRRLRRQRRLGTP